MLKDIKSGRSIFIIAFSKFWPKEQLQEFLEMMVNKFTTPFTTSTRWKKFVADELLMGFAF